MAYSAEVIADSVSPRGDRLTTLEVTFPRAMLAEFNTHRVLSRNSASSRAIPVVKRLAQVLDDPFVPEDMGRNQPGMQAEEQLTENDKERARAVWLGNRDLAVIGATALIGGLGVIKDASLQERIADLFMEYDYSPAALDEPMHKQLVNRMLEPYLWHTVLVTATEWDNFYALRANPKAQPEIRHAAYIMLNAFEVHEPSEIGKKDWHLPLIRDDERWLPVEQLIKISVARCARVSYLTHAGVRDIEADIRLHNQLLSDGHMSPFEHVARPKKLSERLRWRRYASNFEGWLQYRKTIANEANFAKAQEARQKLGQLGVAEQLAA